MTKKTRTKIPEEVTRVRNAATGKYLEGFKKRHEKREKKFSERAKGAGTEEFLNRSYDL